MAARLITHNGRSTRAWFSGEYAGQAENGPRAQEGEAGYLIDTAQEGVYRNGVWVFYKSERQLLEEIRSLLDVVPPSPMVDV